MKQCSQFGCEKSAHAKGYCSKHYSQHVRAGAIAPSWKQENKRDKSFIHANSGAYKTWQHMKARCYDVKHPGYKYYGARGIKVCERWLHSFKNFLEDMGPRPEGTSIDRLNANGNYEPGNCVWETSYVQAMGRRGGILDYSTKVL